MAINSFERKYERMSGWVGGLGGGGGVVDWSLFPKQSVTVGMLV